MNPSAATRTHAPGRCEVVMTSPYAPSAPIWAQSVPPRSVNQYTTRNDPSALSVGTVLDVARTCAKPLFV